MFDAQNLQVSRDRSISHTFGVGRLAMHDHVPEIEKLDEDLSKDTTKISCFSKKVIPSKTSKISEEQSKVVELPPELPPTHKKQPSFNL